MASAIPFGWRWTWLGALLLVASVIIMPLDQLLDQSIHVHHLPGDLLKAIALSEFFAHGFGVLTIIVGVAVLSPGSRRAIPRLALCAVAPGLLAQLMKLTVGRNRPLAFNFVDPAETSTWLGWFPHWHEKPAGMDWYAMSSFPSGHTATAMGLAIGMAWLFPRGKYFFLTLACMAGFQRIAFSAHWTSDVVFSMGIALIAATWITRSSSVVPLLSHDSESRS